jgi:pyruvate kinase
LTATVEMSQRLALYRGVTPLVISHSENTDKMVRDAERIIMRRGLLQVGDVAIILSGKQAFPAARYMTKIHQIGER